jgi:hypothetical protein
MSPAAATKWQRWVREFARYIADEMVSRAELVLVSGAKLG